jgi:hypothetical protein
MTILKCRLLFMVIGPFAELNRDQSMTKCRRTGGGRSAGAHISP